MSTSDKPKANSWGFGYNGKASKPKDYDHNERLHQQALERKKARMQAGFEHNQRLHEEAEARRVEQGKQRAEASKSFEWGGKKYPVNFDPKKN